MDNLVRFVNEIRGRMRPTFRSLVEFSLIFVRSNRVEKLSRFERGDDDARENSSLPSLSEASATYARAYICTVFSSRKETPSYNRINITRANCQPRFQQGRSLSLLHVSSTHHLSWDKSRLFRKTFEAVNNGSESSGTDENSWTRLFDRWASWPTFQTRGARFTIVLEAEKLVDTIHSVYPTSRRYADASRACLRAMKQGYHCVLVNDSCVATVSNVALFSDPENRASDAGSIERFPSRDRIMRIVSSRFLHDEENKSHVPCKICGKR